VNSRRLTYVLAALAAAGVALRAPVLVAARNRANCGADFPVFYVAGKLAASAELYSPAAVQALESGTIGCTSDSSSFIRLPYIAALNWPLSHLPFRVASDMWFWAGVGAVVGFILLWSGPKMGTAAAMAWSLAIAWDLTQGNDVSFLLLWIALGLFLLRRGRPFWAGLVFSLLMAKAHLFVLLPALLAFKGMWRVVYGGIAGCAALLALSFAVQGGGWAPRFLQAATDSRIDPHPEHLQNIRGIAGGDPALEALLATAVLLAALYICRRGGLEGSLCVVLAGGLLLSYHTSASDLALLVPVALMMVRSGVEWLKIPGLIFLTPVPWYLSVPFPRATALSLVALLALLAAQARRRSQIPALK
jgi:hypothetical protein